MGHLNDISPAESQLLIFFYFLAVLLEVRCQMYNEYSRELGPGQFLEPLTVSLAVADSCLALETVCTWGQK